MKAIQQTCIKELLQDYKDLISEAEWAGGRSNKVIIVDSRKLKDPSQSALCFNIDHENDIEIIKITSKRFSTLFDLKSLIKYCPKVKILDLASFNQQVIFYKDIIDILDQLDIIDLSGLKLNYNNSKLKATLISLDQFFLAWGLTHGNCVGLITNGAELTNFQTFLKQSDSLEISDILQEAKKYDGLLEFAQESFKINDFRDKLTGAIKALDESFSKIKSDPNSSVSNKALLPAADPALVEAIMSLTSEQILALSHQYIYNKKILIKISTIENLFYSIKNNLEIKNTKIIDYIQHQDGDGLSSFVRNTVLAKFLRSSAPSNTKNTPNTHAGIKLSVFYPAIKDFIDDKQMKEFILVAKKKWEKEREKKWEKANDSKANILHPEEVKEQWTQQQQEDDQSEVTQDIILGKVHTD